MLVIVDWGFFDEFLLLRGIGYYNNRSVAMSHRTKDLVHDGMNLDSVMQYQDDMSEQDWVVPTDHSLRFDDTWLPGDLMRYSLRKRILDVSDCGLSTMNERANNQNRVHRRL